MVPESAPESPAPESADSRGRDLVPGLIVTVLGVAASMLAHRLVPGIGLLTWAVLLGAVIANLELLPAVARPGLHVATRRLLRIGVVLLGFAVSLGAILDLGAPVITLVVMTLVSTLLATTWLGLRMGVGGPRSLLIATGFAICGASAIAAMEENAEADDDDVALAIAMVTLFGTITMIVVPLLQGPLGLTDTEVGAWAGASVHEVGQVIAAAGPAGATAVAVAVVVKLTRVLLLAPAVAGVSVLRRRRAAAAMSSSGRTELPPLVPLFVLGFLVCMAVRSTGIVPAPMLVVIGHLQDLALGAALFGMGTGVHVRSLLRGSGPALLLSTISTLVVAGVSLVGVVALV